MPHFFKQEKGLLNPPPGFLKWHISWTLDNVLEGFKFFYSINQRYPNHIDLQKISYLPNVKTLERKFGGIIAIRRLLGDTEPDHSGGMHRSQIAKKVTERAFKEEIIVYKMLVKKFGDAFVHFQSRVVYDNNQFVDVDYLVFYKGGKFAIDIFHPDPEWTRFSSNVTYKRNNYKAFPYKIFLCVMTEEITKEMIDRINISQKLNSNTMVSLINYEQLLTIVRGLSPLQVDNEIY